MAKAKELPLVKLVIYDFDQTISREHLYHRLDGGGLPELENFGQNELWQVFGGEERVNRLEEHFRRVTATATIAIVSYGFVDVIRESLNRMGLGQYWDNATVIGCDSEALKNAGFKKDKIISQLRKKLKLNCKETLFVDDDPNNIRKAKHANVTRVLEVAPREGVTEAHMKEIETAVGFDPSTEQHNSNGNADPPNKKSFQHSNGNDDDQKSSDNSSNPMLGLVSTIGGPTSASNGKVPEKRRSEIKVTSPKTVMEERGPYRPLGADNEPPNKDNPDKDKQKKPSKFDQYVPKIPKELEDVFNDGNNESPEPVYFDIHTESPEPSMSEDGGHIQLGFPPI